MLGTTVQQVQNLLKLKKQGMLHLHEKETRVTAPSSFFLNHRRPRPSIPLLSSSLAPRRPRRPLRPTSKDLKIGSTTRIRRPMRAKRLVLLTSGRAGAHGRVDRVRTRPTFSLFFFFFLSSLDANGFARGLKLNEIEHYKLDESKGRCPRETFFVSRFSPAFRMLEEDTRVSATIFTSLIVNFHVSYILSTYKTHSGPQHIHAHATLRPRCHPY